MLRSPPVVRKAPTPLRSTQLTPQDSLAASQQTHIEELVQKNRTLEHTIKKLQEALQREEDRGKDAVTKIQQQWQVERTQWREGCDTVESCHRNVQLRTLVELEKERLNVLKEQDVTRKEKFSRLQRDVKITMFQKRETELEYRIGELEDELEDLKATRDEDVADLLEQHQDIVLKLKLKCAELVADAESQVEELTAAQKQRDLIQKQFDKLRDEHSQIQITSEATASKLERTALQLEGAQTKNAELERASDDLRRENVDIKRQLDKWQNLENKGDAEVEALRKRRIDLEVQVKDMQIRIDEAAGQSTERLKALEKEKKRTEKLKASLKEWEDHAEQKDAETEEAEKNLAKAQRQIEKLRTELETERAKPCPPTPIKPTATKVRSEPDPPSDEDVIEEVAPPVASAKPPSKSQGRPRPRPKVKPGKATAQEVEDGNEDVQAGPSKKRTTRHRAGEVQEDDVQQPTQTKRKGKSKAVEADSDVELLEPDSEVEPTPPAKEKGKRKAASKIDSDADVDDAPPAKAKGKAKAVAERPKRQRTVSGTRGGKVPPKVTKSSRIDEDEDSAVEGNEAPKKKKRKINLFPTNVEPTFSFSPLGADSGSSIIPTTLSPVKESEIGLNRSNSGSLVGSLGRALISSFTRR